MSRYTIMLRFEVAVRDDPLAALEAARTLLKFTSAEAAEILNETGERVGTLTHGRESLRLGLRAAADDDGRRRHDAR